MYGILFNTQSPRSAASAVRVMRQVSVDWRIRLEAEPLKSGKALYHIIMDVPDETRDAENVRLLAEILSAGWCAIEGRDLKMNRFRIVDDAEAHANKIAQHRCAAAAAHNAAHSLP